MRSWASSSAEHLHSGSKTGPKVKSRKQAIAIGLSQTKQSKYAEGGLTQKEPYQPDLGTIAGLATIPTPDEAASLRADDAGTAARLSPDH